jgi:hypothetical protein
VQKALRRESHVSDAEERMGVGPGTAAHGL